MDDPKNFKTTFMPIAVIKNGEVIAIVKNEEGASAYLEGYEDAGGDSGALMRVFVDSITAA